MIARPRALSLRDKMFASQEAASPDTMSGVPSNLGWPCEARGLSFPGPWKGTISLLQSVSRVGRFDWRLECSNFFPMENFYPTGEAPWDSGSKRHTPCRESEIYQTPTPLPPRGYARGKDGLRQRQSLDSPRHWAVRGWSGAVLRELLPSASRSCHLPGTDF